jgi:hypothetical protein
MQLLRGVVRDAATSRDAIMQFGVDTADATFLFGAEIENYLVEIRKKAAEQMHLAERLNNRALPVGEERTALSERARESPP